MHKETEKVHRCQKVIRKTERRDRPADLVLSCCPAILLMDMFLPRYILGRDAQIPAVQLISGFLLQAGRQLISEQLGVLMGCSNLFPGLHIKHLVINRYFVIFFC